MGKKRHRLNQTPYVRAIISQLKKCYNKRATPGGAHRLHFGRCYIGQPEWPECQICGARGKKDRRFCLECKVCICTNCVEGYHEEITGESGMEERCFVRRT